MKKQEEVDEFLLSLNPEQLKEYNLLTGWGLKFNEIKTALINHVDMEFKKRHTVSGKLAARIRRTFNGSII